MVKLGLIFLGSGVCGVLRYAIAGWVQKPSGSGFPVGTLVVNVLGCLLVGLLGAALSARLIIREEYRLALTIGVLGGFTTFSTFGHETFALLNDGQHLRAIMNVALSVGVGLAAVWLGYRLAESWLGA